MAELLSRLTFSELEIKLLLNQVSSKEALRKIRPDLWATFFATPYGIRHCGDNDECLGFESCNCMLFLLKNDHRLKE